MTEITVHSPNAAYNGVSAGVRFVDGVGKVDDKQNVAALDYFRRRGYALKSGDSAPLPGDVLVGQQTIEESDLPKLKAELQRYATARGIPYDVSDTVDVLRDRIIGFTPISDPALAPASVAGDGPVGAQHNVGRDGADPSNVDVGTGIVANAVPSAQDAKARADAKAAVKSNSAPSTSDAKTETATKGTATTPAAGSGSTGSGSTGS